RAALAIGNEDGLDAVLLVHPQQPLVGAVGGTLVEHHLGRAHLGLLDELLAQAFRDVGHLREVGDAGLVNPLHHLARTERLLAEGNEIRFHLVARHAKQIYLRRLVHFVFRLVAARPMPGGDFPLQRVRGQISLSLKKNAISFFAVSGASEPCTTFSSTVSAKSARIVPGAASFGLVAPITSRFFAIAFSPSSTWTMTGPEIMNLTRSL